MTWADTICMRCWRYWADSSASAGFARTREPMRPYTNSQNPDFMTNMEYETINHLSAALEFECGAYGTLVCASDAYAEKPRLEFFAPRGSIVYEDPNSYGARVLLSRKGQGYDYVEMPLRTALRPTRAA